MWNGCELSVVTLRRAINGKDFFVSRAEITRYVDHSIHVFGLLLFCFFEFALFVKTEVVKDSSLSNSARLTQRLH